MNLIIMPLKKIAKLLFNRIFYVALASLIQLGWIFVMVMRLTGYSRYISVGSSILSILVVLWISNKKINPSYKLAWTLLIMGVPVFGLVLYLLFGQSRLARNMQRRYEDVLKSSASYLQEDPGTRNRLRDRDESAFIQSEYIRRVSGYPIHEHTTAEYFQVGDDMFPVLVRELKEAKHYIYIEYFIINDGIMWRTILSILEKKAAEGVDVRLIYDDFGCLTTLPHKYYEFLREKGIKCVVFNPFRPLLNVVLNNRDHRKICVIDGHTGFTGGINLADEYINQKERFGHWKDTAVMLKGEGVWNMTAMFLHMWTVVTRSKDTPDFEEYLPHKYHPEPFPSDGFVQPYCDSPLDGETVGENIYLNIINRAKHYVYICTPYLIIDNEMMTALCLAAKSGIDVKIMTPGIPDKKMVFLLTQSYYEQLIQAGVEIYEYQPGFLHAKSFVCDDEIGVVGTINLDYRSLYHHFECAAYLYGTACLPDIARDFGETLQKCQRVTRESMKQEPMIRKVMGPLLKAFAPLL